MRIFRSEHHGNAVKKAKGTLTPRKLNVDVLTVQRTGPRLSALPFVRSFKLKSHLISLSKFNLPLIGSFYATHAARALQSHDLSGEGIKLWITDIIFLTTQGHGGPPGWVISPMPGPSPRQHKHEKQYTPSTPPFIPTRRIWNDDYDCGQMIYGDLVGLKFPDICLTGEENPEKPHPGNLSRQGIEPGPAAWQACMLPLTPQRSTINIIFVVEMRIL